jgi:hypothetical protein
LKVERIRGSEDREVGTATGSGTMRVWMIVMASCWVGMTSCGKPHEVRPGKPPAAPGAGGPAVPAVAGRQCEVLHRWPTVDHPGRPVSLYVLRSRAEAERLTMESNPFLDHDYRGGEVAVIVVFPKEVGASGSSGSPGRATIHRVCLEGSDAIVDATIVEPHGEGLGEAWWGPSTGQAVAVALPKDARVTARNRSALPLKKP